ncbi:Hypothetical predicted protein [Olea europaea subsp. europaea]|uniref:Uncharacterized protein n=1 Tax=Olea europaea subsp. europaea TaxID=158383 RepID=A0A8S0VMI7_OLEEU|nr:Hypothetical predicted protein [Olea europaea subsp. europaea]
MVDWSREMRFKLQGFGNGCDLNEIRLIESRFRVGSVNGSWAAGKWAFLINQALPKKESFGPAGDQKFTNGAPSLDEVRLADNGGVNHRHDYIDRVVDRVLDDGEGFNGQRTTIGYGKGKEIIVKDGDSDCCINVEIESNIHLFTPFNNCGLGLIQMKNMTIR